MKRDNLSNNILAIIPARGGSKGIPRKNLKPILGKPLIHYSIVEALKSKWIDRTIVSTDDEEIAEASRQSGAQIPFMRPAELGGDQVTDLPVFQHALQWLLENENYKPDIIVHLRPTAPLRTVFHIDKGIEMLLESNADSVRSICSSPEHPCKMWKFDGSLLDPFLPTQMCGKEAYNMPRQSLSPVYVQNASVDVTRWGTIMGKNSMTGDNILGMLMEERDSINIDTETEFMLAELLLNRRENQD